MQPSNHPTIQPSNHPTIQPSNHPTIQLVLGFPIRYLLSADHQNGPPLFSMHKSLTFGKNDGKVYNCR
ncbi:PT domain-containing protein [Proteinivorax hydrogeniformans]